MSDPLAALALACAVPALGCAVWAVTRSTPARVMRAAHEAGAAIETLDTEWRNYRTSLNGWLEEASGVLESVERKRRRISGAASKMEQGNGTGEPDPTANPDAYREFWERRARAQGLL